MLRLLLIIFCILFFSTKITYSKDSLYLFGSLGLSNYSIGNSDITEVNNKLTGLGFATSSTIVDSKKLSYEYGLGMNVLKLFAMELSYLDLGQVSIESTTTSPGESLNAKVNIEGTSVDIIKTIGPIGFTGGLIKIDDDITISSSLGSVDVPIGDYFLPKIGASVQINNYRIEANRTFLTPNSNLNNFMFSYIFSII